MYKYKLNLKIHSSNEMIRPLSYFGQLLHHVNSPQLICLLHERGGYSAAAPLTTRHLGTKPPPNPPSGRRPPESARRSSNGGGGLAPDLKGGWVDCGLRETGADVRAVGAAAASHSEALAGCE